MRFIELLRKIYQKSPEFVKVIVGKSLLHIPFPYVYGLKFVNYYNFIIGSQWWSEEKLEAFQNERLKIIINHAYENVPYYRRIFDERGLKPKDILRKEDLKLLPILTKDDVRKHFNELRAQNYKNFNPHLFRTSGSTGQPLEFYLDKDLSIIIQAAVWRHWQWCGIKYGDLFAIFRGSMIDKIGKKQSYYYKRLGNQIHFSTFGMTEKIMTEYFKKLNEIRPDVIQAYPSSLEILVKFMIRKKLKLDFIPKAIHTGSETVLPEQRKIIENMFRAPLFDLYGHVEGTICAGECEYHKGLHLNSEIGLTEFIKTKETENMDDVYDIVSTSLWNFSMPFIRYHTEDLALLEKIKCPCGRGLPLIKQIIGRHADIIKGANGIFISPSSFVHFWKYKVADSLQNIFYTQLVQMKKDLIIVKLVGEKEKKNEDIIRSQLNSLLGNMKIEFEYLSQIPTGQKWRFTVSKI